MTDRTGSPAYQMPPRSARRVFGAIERAIGNGSSASVSYSDFRFDHHIGRQNISVSLKLLDHLGLIEIEPGPRLVNVFRFSNRWRTVDEVEAVRLAALAREVQPRRRFEKRREPQPVKPAPAPKPMTIGRPRAMQRRVPSLPRCRGMTMGGSVSQPRSRPRPGRRCPLTGAKQTSRRRDFRF